MIKQNINYNRIASLLSILLVFALIIASLFNNSINTYFDELFGLSGIAKTELKKIEQITDSVETAFVQRVIDGDTFELKNGIKIRMLNVDTPESVKQNTAVQCYALEAKEKLKRLIENKNIYLTSDKDKKDRYNRDLRFVYLSLIDAEKQNIEKSINFEIVKNGYARSIAYKPNTTFSNTFNSSMSEAISKKIGLWGACSEPFVS